MQQNAIDPIVLHLPVVERSHQSLARNANAQHGALNNLIAFLLNITCSQRSFKASDICMIQ